MVGGDCRHYLMLTQPDSRAIGDNVRRRTE
jgi:hypothetical protein